MIDNFNKTEAQAWHNSTFLSDEEWAEENAKATGMQKIIFRIFELNPGFQTTGWLLKRFLEAKTGKYVNINSTRRCLSNLKKEMRLFKTGLKRTGEEGKEECFYAANEALIASQNDYLKDNQPSTADLAVNLIKTTDKIQIQFEFD